MSTYALTWFLLFCPMHRERPCAEYFYKTFVSEGECMIAAERLRKLLDGKKRATLVCRTYPRQAI